MLQFAILSSLPVLNEDFTVADPLMVTIPTVSVAGSTACANITILDDDVLEFEHDFTVQLSNTVPAGVVLGALMSTTVTIQDNEGKECTDIDCYMHSVWLLLMYSGPPHSGHSEIRTTRYRGQFLLSQILHLCTFQPLKSGQFANQDTFMGPKVSGLEGSTVIGVCRQISVST